jgi:hypothetical protein
MQWLKWLEGDIRIPRETIDESSIGRMSISIVFAQLKFIGREHFPDLGFGQTFGFEHGQKRSDGTNMIEMSMSKNDMFNRRKSSFLSRILCPS